MILILKSQRQEDYYFVGELATPLLTMYETYYFGLCGMTKDQLYAERDAFYSTLKAILSHPDNAECNDQFKLLYWSDPETGVWLLIVETQDELSAYFKLCILSGLVNAKDCIRWLNPMFAYSM